MDVTTQRVDIRVLGPVHLFVDARELSVGGPRPSAVLAVLTINRRRVVPMDVLANAVWDRHPPEEYANGLHVFVARLRRSLGSAGVDRKILRTVTPGYRLDISDAECDVGRFECAREAGRKAVASGAPATAAAYFRHALDQWNGVALANLRANQYADNFSTAMEEERLATVSDRISADLCCGRASEVVGELRALTAEHPLREQLWGQLITALYLSEQQAEALKACRRVRQILADELGIDPSSPLVQLEQQVLRQEPLALGTDGAAEMKAQTMTSTVAEIARTLRSGRLRFDDGRIVAVPSKGLRIGRRPDNDLPLDDPKVSRHHARILPSRGGLMIKDLDSINGVFVDGVQIGAGVALSTGAVIRIGATTMIFEEI
ncbi:FHA domain-containing protein [Nocardia gipuzkoensis]|uniref:BTAD domain-containing putative transcriptional regulator n=1 Tax=Nocardia gipuzkoensis TaxID=2749991 RepID=UPI001E3788A1|nr:BTAD domain-containing putative transcriptional regulator [Nocardia gipuzkoensis]UGT67737.1 FHA domain-containing protein [Nocardia gipuzkoensis]